MASSEGGFLELCGWVFSGFVDASSGVVGCWGVHLTTFEET